MVITEERISRLEGGYEHLATRADIPDLRTEIAAMGDRLLFRLGGLVLGSNAVLGTALGVLIALNG